MVFMVLIPHYTFSQSVLNTFVKCHLGQPKNGRVLHLPWDKYKVNVSGESSKLFASLTIYNNILLVRQKHSHKCSQDLTNRTMCFYQFNIFQLMRGVATICWAHHPPPKLFL